MSSNYSSWPIRPLKVTSLHLDPDNPRIPAGDKRLPQRALLEELVRHDNVYALAKSIAANGYFPTEVIVTYKDTDDGKRYVVEGNRRVAAVKCLLSPDAAPQEFKTKFARLARSVDPKSIEKINVLTAPNRKAALPLLLDRHTHEQIQRWSRPMQAQFLRRLKDDGMSLEQIAAWSTKTVADVRKLLMADALYTAACNIPLDDATANKVGSSPTLVAG